MDATAYCKQGKNNFNTNFTDVDLVVVAETDPQCMFRVQTVQNVAISCLRLALSAC